MRLIDLTGRRFGRLEVIERRGCLKGMATWLCKCDCGIDKLVASYYLLNGKTRSCGCLANEHENKFGSHRATHRMTRSKIYRTWASMLSRCNNRNVPGYKNYGARGIKVCDRWLSFDNFYADMGNAPKDMTLDRIDNDGGYSPENCRWATRSEQSRNRRIAKNAKILVIDGKKRLVIDVAAEYGINRSTLRSRISRGWTVERIISCLS